MKDIYKYLLLISSLIFCSCVSAQVTVFNANTDMKLLKKFQNAKLGLFVHWMACHTPETGDSWAIGRGTTKKMADSITMNWYPEKFNAKEIVDIAVKAGCKYMVVISKHHDGFCIWPSKYSVFNVDRVSYNRDILKELSVECKRKKMLFGIYYSIADIDYCGWSLMPSLGDKVPVPKYGKNDFISFVKNQTLELVENYKPDILWFDGFWLDNLWGAKEGKELYYTVKSKKKNTLLTRLSYVKGKDGKEQFLTDGSSGDYFSLEAKTVETPPYPWESCTSITYPVYAYEPNAKLLSRKELIETFNKTLCGNGNLLVNIGPKPDGSMPIEQVKRLYELSDWIYSNVDAVYKTNGGPFRPTQYIGSTYANNFIYLHLRDIPDKLQINTLDGYKLEEVKILSTGRVLDFDLNNNVYTIDISSLKRKSDIQVLALRLDKKYQFTDWLPLMR